METAEAEENIREHYRVLNYALANDRDDLKWFFVFHRIQCYCGWESTAVHRMRFELNPDLPVLQKNLQLIHIEGAVFYPINSLVNSRLQIPILPRLHADCMCLTLHISGNLR